MSTFIGGRISNPFGTIGTLASMNVTQQTFMESFSADGVTYQIGDITLSLGGQFQLTADGVTGQVTGFFLQKLTNAEITELGASFNTLSLAEVEARFNQAFNLQAALDLFPGDSQIILMDWYQFGIGVPPVLISPSMNLNGGVGNDFLEGTSKSDTLSGGSGDDTLAGANLTLFHSPDLLIGGIGNDTYYVDAGTTVTENDGEGDDDAIESLIDYSLEGTFVEHLTLVDWDIALLPTTGTGNGADNRLTGNRLDNSITGGAGDDTLEGAAGNDTLEGGQGDDVYRTDGDDVITELPGGGTDTIESTVSWVLEAEFEDLILLGDEDLAGTGNEGPNLITGNAGDNTLNGRGGIDTLVGGAGNDTYILGPGDVWIDEGGTDTVVSPSGFASLPAGLENATLGGRAGNAGIMGSGGSNHLVGNGGANLLQGGAGDDTIEGARGDDTLVGGTGNDRLVGGRGVDVMDGGSGNDLYVVGSVRDQIVELAGGGVDTVEVDAPLYALPANVENARMVYDGGSWITGNALANRFIFSEIGGVDHIVDFVSGVDRVVLDDAVFTNPGLLLYDDATGALSYDGVQFAVFTSHPADLGDIQFV